MIAFNILAVPGPTIQFAVFITLSPYIHTQQLPHASAFPSYLMKDIFREQHH